MKKLFIILSLQCIVISLMAQHKPAYVIYNANGQKVAYEAMIKKLEKSDIVLFGELHNNPVAHWLQYEVTSELGLSKSLILGAEMFEADNQTVLTNYLEGNIDSKGLDSLARLWPNYKTDYQPLVDYAKENQLPFIATNIPRRYANRVFKKGFEALDSLTAKEKSWIAPLPIPFDSELPTYKNILKMMGHHASPKLVMAQAIKDATMAHFILMHYKAGHLLLHFNGAYHSDYYEGILWYLKGQNPELHYATISTVTQENIHQLLEENQHKADFIICVDSDMTTTY